MTDLATIVKTDDDVYKTLLESTKAIPWKIDWATMQFAYIGPQIESLLGWSPQSWATVDDWAARMHEDDRERVVNFCVTQSKGGFDHEADYRALTKDGRYVWLRDVVHVVRNLDGSVNSLVGFMFDISERKIAEEQLAALQKELEILSFVDGLTGIANRRRFDQVMKTEWANARRNSQPLSLVMVDIDHFKAYNDHYGHLQGDESLKRAAQGVKRSSDAATRCRGALWRRGVCADSARVGRCFRAKNRRALPQPDVQGADCARGLAGEPDSDLEFWCRHRGTHAGGRHDGIY